LLALFGGPGLLGLDDQLQKCRPASIHVPTSNQQSIALRQLATHTSGLPRRGDEPVLTKVNGVLVWGYATDDEVFNFLNTYQLTRPPGAKWEYSNLTNGILGVAEERVGQSNYDSLVTNQVTGPLSMPDMRITLSAAEQATLAPGLSNERPAGTGHRRERCCAGGGRPAL
jgi:D-alanyl-D-alanine-carboxypeptidase/D-alanyl-D-alanine-endopeptidase